MLYRTTQCSTIMFFSVKIRQMRLRRPTVANPRVPKDMIVLPDGTVCRASDPEYFNEGLAKIYCVFGES
jgi:hypothetical protein